MAAPLKSYIDRVLNILGEIDDKGDDKREIYKELAADGYDRTVVSQVVGHLRKKASKPGKFAEQSKLFDLYLADYEGVGTRVATHTLHADHDAETGEIKSEAAETSAGAEGRSESASGAASDNAPNNSPETVNEAAEERRPSSVSGSTAPGPVQQLDASNSANIIGVTVGSDQSGTAAQIHESSSINDKASSTVAPQGEAVHSQGTGAETLAGREGRSEGQAAPADLPTNPRAFIKQLRPHCLNPDACGGQGRNHCFSCSVKIKDDPAESEAA